jgi:hypothetical protein
MGEGRIYAAFSPIAAACQIIRRTNKKAAGAIFLPALL